MHILVNNLCVKCRDFIVVLGADQGLNFNPKPKLCHVEYETWLGAGGWEQGEEPCDSNSKNYILAFSKIMKRFRI